jgi:hypothetical protein
MVPSSGGGPGAGRGASAVGRPGGQTLSGGEEEERTFVVEMHDVVAISG